MNTDEMNTTETDALSRPDPREAFDWGEEMARMEAEAATRPDPQEPRGCSHHPGELAEYSPGYNLDPAFPFACPACREILRERAMEARRHRAGIPRKVRHATLDNFQIPTSLSPLGEGSDSPMQFLSAARLAASGKIRNLILTGTTGIGKSHLAAAVANETLLAGKRVVWSEARSLFSVCHGSYEGGGVGRGRILAPLQTAAILVMDECAFRHLPADGEEILSEIFFHRYENDLPSVLISNHRPEVLNDWLGPRISDRLTDGGCLALWGAWASYRNQTAK